MASIIGKENESYKYDQLAKLIARAFNNKFLNKKTGQYESNTQSANLLPVAFGITPKNYIDKVMANVVADIKKRGNHLSTGFLGTNYILPLLSQYGYHDLAYKLATQKTYPSWGYMVEKNATTIWELWNSDTEGPGMNSRNHFALGSVGEWYFGYLAGLRPDPAVPGFQRTIIKPMPVGDLKWAKASLETGYGKVSSRWEKRDDKLTLKISIPANTSAMVYVPTIGKGNPTIMEGEKILLSNDEIENEIAGIEFQKQETDVVIFKVGAGNYEFVVLE